jgi:hypothetical protein
MRRLPLAGWKQWLGQTLAMTLLVGTATFGGSTDLSGKRASADLVRSAAKEGKLAFRLTTPEELRELLGPPGQERKGREGDMDTLALEFPDVEAGFGRPRESPRSFTLFWLNVQGKSVDIGRDRQIVLRTEDDLNKLDSFWGLADVSLAKLDLRAHLLQLSGLTFDSLTVWPGPERLPAGFDPTRLLEEGKNPGLGVRQLHEAGIDGRGIGIAVIDQPLLREHEEYKDGIARYVPVEVDGVPPQMHGPAVASIAVGKSCGVAPKAALYFFAVPTWKWGANKPWAEQLERVVELNQGLTNTPKIRVVSISLGAFSERPEFERWQRSVQKATDSGILVATCDPAVLRIATLKRMEDRTGESPADYERGRYVHPGSALGVPAANRTIASYKGPQAFTYDRTGGMSWTVPYLAGLAALAWQVDPTIQPKEMIQLWKQTAVNTEAGLVVNPAGLIEAIKKRR